MRVLVADDMATRSSAAKLLYGIKHTVVLGYTPAEKRSVKPMPKWVLDLVPKPDGKNEIVKPKDVDTERDTIPYLKGIVARTLYHTAKLAPKLKGRSLQETTHNIWQFVFDHVKYVPDKEGDEELRSPRRTIWEARGDCDCMCILISSLLTNLKIGHSLRVMKEKSKADDWGHIYIIVPVNGGQITMDCVTHAYNFEASHVDAKDFPMKLGQLKYLDGLHGDDQCDTDKNKPSSKRYPFYERTQQFIDQGLILTESFLKQNSIPYTVVEVPNYGFRIGTTFVGPVIKPQEALNLLKPEVQNPPSPQIEPIDHGDCGCKKKNKSIKLLLWGIGLGAVTAWALSPSEKSSKAA